MRWSAQPGNAQRDDMKAKLDLPFLERDRWSDDERYNVVATGDDQRFTFEYSRMYEHPPLGYAQLRAMAEHWGTEKIDTEQFGESGCETCDYGSRYGHTIIVEGATKNLPFGTKP